VSRQAYVKAGSLPASGHTTIALWRNDCDGDVENTARPHEEAFVIDNIKLFWTQERGYGLIKG